MHEGKDIWAIPLAVTDFNVLVALLGGFISLFGLVSYLLKENYYLSEARECPITFVLLLSLHSMGCGFGVGFPFWNAGAQSCESAMQEACLRQRRAGDKEPLCDGSMSCASKTICHGILKIYTKFRCY